MMQLKINGKAHSLDIDGSVPLLWAIRERVGLTGTKFGCGVGACGSCTVLMDGNPVRSCRVPTSAAVGHAVTTIEGLDPLGRHVVQEAWIAESVPQCGYCQSGMILAAVALLASKPNPTDAEIDAAVTNLCRCGTYDRVRRAIHRASTVAGTKA
jgi:isoquinoline 1-oxidoreductase alpha subunit